MVGGKRSVKGRRSESLPEGCMEWPKIRDGEKTRAIGWEVGGKKELDQ